MKNTFSITAGFLLSLLISFTSTAQSFNMNLLSNVDLPGLPTRFGAEYNDCWGYRHSNGTEVAIIGGTEDIFFFNITDPVNPVLMYTHHVTNLPNGTTNESLWRDFKTYQHYLYAAADEGTSGLLIFNLNNVPNSVTMVKQTNEFWNRTHNIYIDEENGRLYAAGSNSASTGLVILDLAVYPDDPELEQSVPLTAFGGGYVHDVHVRDNIAYCSHGNMHKLQIYDFSNLPNVTVVGTIDNYPEEGYNHSSWVNADGTYLVMCDETQGSDVKLIDITDPMNISPDDISTFYSELLGPDVPGSSLAHNPFILGELAFIAYYHDGVQVFDISDPDNIELVAYYDTYPANSDYLGYEGCWGVYPYLPSGNIIASDQNYGLYVMEVTSSPLDIEFIAFEARRRAEGIKLDWSVEDASFGNRFEIARSADGGQSFHTIAAVSFNEDLNHYAYMDEKAFASQSYVYRVDFVELDGQRRPSPLRSVSGKDQSENIRLANPVRDELILEVLQPMLSLDLALYDMEGRLIWSVQLDDVRVRHPFSLYSLPAGQYLLQALWPGGGENRMIQKL